MSEPTTEVISWTVQSDDDDRHVLSAPGDYGTVVLYGDRKYADMLVSAAMSRARVPDSGVPPEPTTEAGRRLLKNMLAMRKRVSDGPLAQSVEDFTADILATEAEARASQPLMEARCVCGNMPPTRPWHDADNPCRDGNGNFNPGHRYIETEARPSQPLTLNVGRLAEAIEFHSHEGQPSEVVIGCGRGHVELCAPAIAAEYERLGQEDDRG